jgi:hypothetical protein
MNSNDRKQLRKICCEEHSDIIKGRRMTDFESKIFHGWTDILNGISEEELNEIFESYIKK